MATDPDSTSRERTTVCLESCRTRSLSKPSETAISHEALTSFSRSSRSIRSSRKVKTFMVQCGRSLISSSAERPRMSPLTILRCADRSELDFLKCRSLRFGPRLQSWSLAASGLQIYQWQARRSGHPGLSKAVYTGARLQHCLVVFTCLMNMSTWLTE